MAPAIGSPSSDGMDHSCYKCMEWRTYAKVSHFECCITYRYYSAHYTTSRRLPRASGGATTKYGTAAPHALKQIIMGGDNEIRVKNCASIEEKAMILLASCILFITYGCCCYCYIVIVVSLYLPSYLCVMAVLIVICPCCGHAKWRPVACNLPSQHVGQATVQWYRTPPRAYPYAVAVTPTQVRSTDQHQCVIVLHIGLPSES